MQVAAIKRVAERYKVAAESMQVVVGCLGLPDGWASVSFEGGDGRWLAMGVSPEGAGRG